jgi:hypothetical protein
MGVSRALLAAGALAVAAVVAGSAAALSTGGGPALRVTCSSTTFLVAFNPKGEPTDKRPHVRIYTAGESLASVHPASASFGRSCTAAKDAAPRWGGGASRTTRKKIRLRCSLPSRLALRSSSFTGPAGTYIGNKLAATIGKAPRSFLVATMRRSGSSVRYATRYCTRR